MKAAKKPIEFGFEGDFSPIGENGGYSNSNWSRVSNRNVLYGVDPGNPLRVSDETSIVNFIGDERINQGSYTHVLGLVVGREGCIIWGRKRRLLLETTKVNRITDRQHCLAEVAT